VCTQDVEDDRSENEWSADEQLIESYQALIGAEGGSHDADKAARVCGGGAPNDDAPLGGWEAWESESDQGAVFLIVSCWSFMCTRPQGPFSCHPSDKLDAMAPQG
jgi:hypothetical protein